MASLASVLKEGIMHLENCIRKEEKDQKIEKTKRSKNSKVRSCKKLEYTMGKLTEASFWKELHQSVRISTKENHK